MIHPVAYIDFEVYEESINYIGVAKVTPPDIEQKTTTLKGAGMSGDLNVPLTGATSNMTLKLDFLSTTGDIVRLMEQRKHQIEVRACEESWDVEDAEVGYWTDKMVFIAVPRKMSPGEVGSYNTPNSSLEFDVYYFAAYRDGVQLWEIDKRNMKHVVNGTDFMATVRKAIGK